MITIEQLFGTLQQSVVSAWRKHLRTAKYAKHIALNEFYEDMPEKVDALIEAWMGANGRKIKGFENILQSANMNTLTYLKELKKVTRQGYELMGENDELTSLLDDIMELINSTLYKVKELNESSIVDLSDYINNSLNESLEKGKNIGLQEGEKATKERIARELISKIQQLRKNKDFNIVDRINIYYSHNDEIEEAIEEYRDMIMKDTLAEQIDERNDLTEEFNINGIEVKLDVARR